MSNNLLQWKQLVDRACGQDVVERSAATDRMAELYGVPSSAGPAELLFAGHSYYALVVNLVLRHAFRDTNACRSELFDWPFESRHPKVASLVEQLRDRLTGYATATQGEEECVDLFGPLYQDVVPRPVRHRLGEYYTPNWLAEHVLDQVGYDGDPACRLLDPACGTGIFLLAAIRRIRRRSQSAEVPVRSVLANIVGMDLNPVAVLSAGANYLMALGGLYETGELDMPVLLRDSILDTCGEPAEPFNVVVGNPPWIAWDSLPTRYREATRPLWQRYGLFSLSANEARHGGGKKDLAMLMLYAAADRYLQHRGRLGMVVTQTVFQTRSAGDGFRRFQLGCDGSPLRVIQVDDLGGVQPFAGATNRTATIVLEKGEPTIYPVPYVKWSPQRGGVSLQTDGKAAGAVQQQCWARPVDPQSPGSPWMVVPSDTGEIEDLIGPSDYQAHLGANTAGANGVFWVEVVARTTGGVLIRNVPSAGKRSIPAIECELETGLLYPLIRWGDVERFAALPRLAILLTQDTTRRRGIDDVTMQRCYPKTLEYLRQFEDLLGRRVAYRRYQQEGPFWSMYNVGPYTLSPTKVVWRRMDRRIRASVIEPFECPFLGLRPVVPQETCVLIAVSGSAEAHYLSALLNSSVVDFLVRSHSVCGGKGFGTPGMLNYLGIQRFDPSNSFHRQLAEAGSRASATRLRGQPVAEVQAEIDRTVGAIRGLSSQQVAALR